MLSGFDNPLHILMLCVVVLLVFGAKRLPEMGRSLGSGMREFKSGLLNQDESIRMEAPHPAPPTAAPAPAATMATSSDTISDS